MILGFELIVFFLHLLGNLAGSLPPFEGHGTGVHNIFENVVPHALPLYERLLGLLDDGSGPVSVDVYKRQIVARANWRKEGVENAGSGSI